MSTLNGTPHAAPSLLDDPKWLRHQYEDLRLGTHEIGRLVGRAPSSVLHVLRKHGIPVRQHRVSRSPKCNAPWLTSHYLDRSEYVTWCDQQGEEPDDDGGLGLSTSACAEIAQVSRETVRRWLVQHGIARRGADDLSSKRKERQHTFSLGRDARVALRRFEAEGAVEGVEVEANEIRVRYETGIKERWATDDGGEHRLRFPDGDWWLRPIQRGDALQGLLGDDEAPTSRAVGGLPCTAKYCASLGFLEQRILVAELVRDLTTEGWRRPKFTTEELEEDLRAVLADGTVHAVTPGYVRGQPGRPPSGVPAGMRLALDLVDWGPLARRGGVTLEQAWRDPRRAYWAIESLIRRGEDISREAVVHRMCVGRAEGLPGKAGALFRTPAYHMALLRDVLGYDRPLVFDATPGTGTKAVAVAALGGIYIHSTDVAIEHDGPLWSPRADLGGRAEIDADDEACAEVGLVDCDDVAEFEQAIDRYGGLCDRIVTRLPWTEREAVLAMGARVVRVKSRPYRGDSVIAIWRTG